MSTHPQFEPLFPAHAIERCSATVTFSEQLPLKAFQKLLDEAQSRFRSAGLERIGGAPGSQAVGFQIDASGHATPLAGPGPGIFAAPDRATHFIVAQNSMTARTTSYVRWGPFAGQTEELMLPLVNLYSDVVSTTSVQLDYLDRFLWTGDWTNFDWRAVLRSDGRFIASTASEGHRLWHTHSGWFDERPEGRRLVNVNVDLMDFNKPEEVVPSIAIVTLMREDVGLDVSRFENAASVQTCLEQLHNDLKALLGQVIVKPMADRIGLSAQPPNVTHH
jgi:hypothetical protein